MLLSIGYLAGLFRERFEIHNSLVPALLCMGLTLVAELGFAAIQLLLGIDAPVSLLIVRDMLLKSVYAFFLGWPIYLLVRRLLRPALVEEPKLQRRRQPTGAGGLEAMYLRSDERGPAVSSRLALRLALFGGVRRGALRDPLPAPLAAAGARRRNVPRRSEEQPHPLLPHQRPAGRKSSTATARCWSPTGPAWRCRSTRASCPADPAERRAELSRLAELTHSTPATRCAGRCTKS